MLAGLVWGAPSAEAISTSGISRQLDSFESKIKTTAKGRPCTCVVPAEKTRSGFPELGGGLYRNNFVVDEAYIKITYGPGVTNYTQAVRVEDTICDVPQFTPYTGEKTHWYSCDGWGNEVDAP